MSASGVYEDSYFETMNRSMKLEGLGGKLARHSLSERWKYVPSGSVRWLCSACVSSISKFSSGSRMWIK